MKRKENKYSQIMVMEMTDPNKSDRVLMRSTVITPFAMIRMEGTFKVIERKHTKEFSNATIKIEKS